MIVAVRHEAMAKPMLRIVAFLMAQVTYEK